MAIKLIFACYRPRGALFTHVPLGRQASLRNISMGRRKVALSNLSWCPSSPEEIIRRPGEMTRRLGEMIRSLVIHLRSGWVGRVGRVGWEWEWMNLCCKKSIRDLLVFVMLFRKYEVLAHWGEKTYLDEGYLHVEVPAKMGRRTCHKLGWALTWIQSSHSNQIKDCNYSIYIIKIYCECLYSYMALWGKLGFNGTSLLWCS